MQRTTLLRPNELSADQVAAWSRIQQADPQFDSPYFRPEFTEAVAKVRGDVEVAVLEEDGEAVGFFPFQRGRFNVGKPVGGPLSDFQAIIVSGGTQWRPDSLIADCGLSAWNFSHLLASQQPFEPYVWNVAPSPYLDLSAGFATYEADRRSSGSDELRQTMRKLRKVQRDIGTVKFVHHTDDESVFETLMAWKSAQYHQSHITDTFAYDWTVKLLRNILARQDRAFAGMLSALYVGERLAAIHLGMRSNAVLHSWFPAYDVSLSKYSVGLILLVELARAAESLEIRRIDLGKGSEPFKRSFMSGATPVAEGSVERFPLILAVRRRWHHARKFVKSSPMGASAKRVAQWLRPARAWLEFR